MKPWLSLLTVLILGFACGAPEGPDDYVEPPPPPEPIDNSRAIPVDTNLSCPNGTRLTYENFGEAFFLTYCTMCHSQGLIGDDRSGAAEGVDLDTATGVLLWRTSILKTAIGNDATMPPAQHVPQDERDQLKEWLNCGAPGKEDRLVTDPATMEEE